MLTSHRRPERWEKRGLSHWSNQLCSFLQDRPINLWELLAFDFEMQKPWMKRTVCWAFAPAGTDSKQAPPRNDIGSFFTQEADFQQAGTTDSIKLSLQTLRAIAFYGHKLKIRSSDGVSSHSLKPAHQCQVPLSTRCWHFAAVPVNKGSGRVSVSSEVQTLICHKWRRWEVSCEIF